VLGNILTPKLTMEPGVVTEGKVTITSGMSDDARKIIEDSFGPETEEAFSTLLKEKKKTKDKEDAGK